STRNCVVSRTRTRTTRTVSRTTTQPLANRNSRRTKTAAIANTGRTSGSYETRNPCRWLDDQLHGDCRHDADQEPRRRNRSAHVFYELCGRSTGRQLTTATYLLFQRWSRFGIGLAAHGCDWSQACEDEPGRRHAVAAIRSCR